MGRTGASTADDEYLPTTMHGQSFNQSISQSIYHHCTHTHTRLTAVFFPYYPGEPVPERQKPMWILLKRDSELQWHQLGHMQVCTSLQTDSHASTPPLSIFQAGCPSCHPTNSDKALKAK